MSDLLLCDGCGQAATPEHLSRRFNRLEQATRYRPIHIETVFLGAASPQADEEYLYSGVENGFVGEAGMLVKAAGIAVDGRPAAAVLGDFQKQGLFLAHVLECPGDAERTDELVAKRLRIAVTRLKRSVKAKRVVLISGALAAHKQAIREAILDVEVLLQPLGTAPLV